MREPKIVRTQIDENTAFVTVRGRSRNRTSIDKFTDELVKSLADSKPPISGEDVISSPKPKGK